jgi:hypothetical protein
MPTCVVNIRKPDALATEPQKLDVCAITPVRLTERAAVKKSQQQRLTREGS